MVRYITQEEYYKPPSQEIFDDIKQACIKVWESKDNTYGYVDEKVSRIKNIQNVGDNYGYMIAMFDSFNKLRVRGYVTREDTLELINSLLFTEAEDLRKMMEDRDSQ